MHKRSNQKKPIISLALILIIISCVWSTAAQKDAIDNIYIIPVAGEIEPGIAAYLKRAFRDIPENESNLAVLKIDSFGGRVDSALDMVDTLLSVSKTKTIAYVEKRAISAGALIALSCNELVMRNNTTIGDCAPITYSSEGPKELGEKFQSPLRAKFRALAKRNNYPEKLAESMVTAEMEVYEVIINGKKTYMDSKDFEELTEKEKAGVESKKTVVARGELLTMNDTEAHELGFSKMSVRDLDEMLQKMNLEGVATVTIEESWSEALVSLITKFAPILMMIGLGALYTEIKSPGFGVPGVIGITCLALVFLNQYFVGLADYTELLFILGGLILLGFELFVTPGFGVAGFAGLLCMGVGMVLALQDFVIPDPALPWETELLISNLFQVTGATLGAFVLSIFTIRFVIPKISVVVDGPYLDTTLKDAHADSDEIQDVHVGDVGVAMTFLRPSGKMKIGTEVFDVIAEGEFIEKGTPIRVLEISGNRVIVIRERQNGK